MNCCCINYSCLFYKEILTVLSYMRTHWFLLILYSPSSHSHPNYFLLLQHLYNLWNIKGLWLHFKKQIHLCGNAALVLSCPQFCFSETNALSFEALIARLLTVYNVYCLTESQLGRWIVCEMNAALAYQLLPIKQRIASFTNRKRTNWNQFHLISLSNPASDLSG